MIYIVNWVTPSENGLQRKQMGRISNTGGKWVVLEDNGLGKEIESMDPDQAQRYFNRMAHNSTHMEVVPVSQA